MPDVMSERISKEAVLCTEICLPFLSVWLIFLSCPSFLLYPTLPSLNTQCCAPCSPTSRDETDGAEKACLRVVHLDGQQLVGKSEHQVGEWAEASVVHLRPVEGQPIWKGHGVLVGGVPRTDAQDLMAGRRIVSRDWERIQLHTYMQWYVWRAEV